MSYPETFYELSPGQFELARRFAQGSAGEREYYHAILNGLQKGRVFADDPNRPRAVLFWHYAGYGFAAGAPDGSFIEQVLAMIRQEHPCFVQDTALKKRFILQQDDPSEQHVLENASGLLRSERLCFAFEGRRMATRALPSGYQLQTADASVLARLTGSVTPSFSWSSNEEFLRGGVACCVMHGHEPAAWAFSAAIGGGRMDIGVETAPAHRGRGLARAAAAALADAALRMELAPVWGCDASNLASARTAESAGFIFYGRHAKFKKAEPQ